MPRKAAIVEEFDDDTDLPLPYRPLPNTGAQGPLLEEITSDDDETLPLMDPAPGPASKPQTESRFRPESSQPTVTDITPYKKWTCIYPIYIDAKRPYGTGERRVARAKSVWWPLSSDIADASSQLGLGTLHEVHKSHPRDWENPGRVRVQLKKDGKFANPSIQTKKQLLEMIAFQIQKIKPENIPKAPYVMRPPKSTTQIPASKPQKGKPPKGKDSTPIMKSSGRQLPIPPEPHPPLANRVSIYSPALPAGVLIETVKAGMNAQEATPGGAPGATGSTAGVGKGKRKVVRVRG